MTMETTMSHDKDKILIRAKDISLLILVLSLFGLIAGPMKKIFKLEDTIQDVIVLKQESAAHKQNIAVVNANLENISKQLDQINWHLSRMRRDR